MDGLAFIRGLVWASPMPMAGLFGFEVVEVARGSVRAKALPTAKHANPFGVTQGGFAGTVLDMALGLVSISVLDGDAGGVATVDLSIRYFRSIGESTGPMEIRAEILHRGRTTVVAEAKLFDAAGKLHASAQSTSIVTRGRGEAAKT
jgi:uncharacterized protein (TIGR00369 family)